MVRARCGDPLAHDWRSSRGLSVSLACFELSKSTPNRTLTCSHSDSSHPNQCWVWARDDEQRQNLSGRIGWAHCTAAIVRSVSLSCGNASRHGPARVPHELGTFPTYSGQAIECYLTAFLLHCGRSAVKVRRTEHHLVLRADAAVLACLVEADPCHLVC